MKLSNKDTDFYVIIRVTSNELLWKMDTNDLHIVKKHHKDLKYKAKALFVKETSSSDQSKRKLTKPNSSTTRANP